MSAGDWRLISPSGLLQVLLVSSTGGRGWIIPGGKVEPFEVDNPSISAIREAREEGGVRGRL